MSMRIAFGRAALGLVVTIASISSGAQALAPAVPLLTESLAGRDSFERYCASCHGPGGHGDGPVGAALKMRPPDLTALTQKNDGSFPREQVLAFVTGTARTPAAHGASDMPVWGTLFRAFESDARVRAR